MIAKYCRCDGQKLKILDEIIDQFINVDERYGRGKSIRTQLEQLRDNYKYQSD